MTDQPPPPPSDQPADQPPSDQPPPSDQSPFDRSPSGQPPGQQPPPYPGAYGQPPGAPQGQPPGQHPAGQYDPRYGYGPPGVPFAPQQNPGEETTWAIFAYVGNLLIGFLPPLVIYLVKKNTSPFTRFHAAQSLNYQLTLLIHLVAVAALCVPPAIALEQPAFLIPLILPYLELIVAGWTFLILGAVKAGKGQYYRFPTFFCFRMIR
ncbi:DUF4870 domain-containing protein [Actinomadura sp. WMMA1423]|uniref:DUF4870 domain-containing protein n=1 Tax=Actinomadura sp. WMMA1423 TaxID=2591108 RepID=UPI001147884A|nr:DUF4870 domain-containing protein [Actinomadura sp. WMMA1423]